MSSDTSPAGLDAQLRPLVRDVPDFPRPGIMFKDISPIMLDSELSSEIIEHLYSMYKTKQIDAMIAKKEPT